MIAGPTRLISASATDGSIEKYDSHYTGDTGRLSRKVPATHAKWMFELAGGTEKNFRIAGNELGWPQFERESERERTWCLRLGFMPSLSKASSTLLGPACMLSGGRPSGSHGWAPMINFA